MRQKRSTKKQILDRLWAMVSAEGRPWRFNRTHIEAAIDAHFRATGVKWPNYADIPKIDFRRGLSDDMLRDDVFIVHLGKDWPDKQGWHEFVSGINLTYHGLEGVDESQVETYERRPLDVIDESNEAGDLSRILNLRLFHKFLYPDRGKEFRVHLPGRKQSKLPLRYHIGPNLIETRGLQIEMDFVAEAEVSNAPLDICISEAKSTNDDNFNVAQLYCPFKYLLESTRRAGYRVNIRNLFVQTIERQYARDNPLGIPEGPHRVARLFEYRFENEDDLATIQHLKSAEYVLIQAA